MITAHGVQEWWWFNGAANGVHFIDGKVDSIHQQK
jgi:hypothetical protein